MKISALYTFGSPRVLSPEAAAYAENTLLAGKVFRHARSGDVVTVVPAKRHGDGDDESELYDHVGLVAVIDGSGELVFDPSAWARTREALGEIRGDLDRAGQEEVDAHRMARYHPPVYEQFRRDPSRVRAVCWKLAFEAPDQ